MDLEDRLPDLLHAAAQETALPISAAKVIAGARRRRARTLLTASTAILALAAAVALPAYLRATPAASAGPVPITPSPVRTVSLYQRVDIEQGLQMWLAETEVCTESQPGLVWDPRSDAAEDLCLPGLVPHPGVHTQPGFHGLSAVGTTPLMAVFGVYFGSPPASIVFNGPGFTKVATLVTSLQLPGEVGYYAMLPLMSFSPVTETAYDAAGHVLATGPRHWL